MSIMTDEERKKKLLELEEELDNFLQTHPHLWKMQFDIEKNLLEIGDDHAKRMVYFQRCLTKIVTDQFSPALDELATSQRLINQNLSKVAKKAADALARHTPKKAPDEKKE